MMQKLALVLPQKTGGTHIERMLTNAGVDFVFLPSLTEDDTWKQKTREEREVLGLVNPKHFSFSGLDSDRCTINNEIAKQYTTVGLIRNPYTWINSWFFHNMADRIERWETEDLQEMILRFCSGYIPQRQKNTMVNACEDYPMHHIFNPNGTVACDYLIFNENLNDGINDLLKIYGSNFRVPPTEKTLVGSWSPDKVLSDWSQEMKRAVASCFEDFIDLFGYEFPGESTIKHSLIDTKGLRLKNFKRIR
tara:strand:+ start:8176 stop:8922 length:747 start_codon:yes stop_codon:yes gene_type:complete